jgi:hypothetical protein
MALNFAIVPQIVQVGPVANGVTITFYYDYTDHGICKMLVAASGGTLANPTMVSFNRHGLPSAAQTTTIPTQDTTYAIPIELNSGDVADSLVVHGPGFGV